MSRPTITVCVVTCNQRELIEQCLRSVLLQEVDADLNVLVGDDASDDGTSEVVASLALEYPSAVLHLRRAARMGSFVNMRELSAQADGEFIAHVDGDDFWLPGKLARQLAFLQAHPDCAVVYTNAVTIGADGSRIGLFSDVGDARFDLSSLLRRGNFLNNSSAMFRTTGKAAWANATVPQIDYRAHLWHARHGWIGHIGDPLTAYRVNTRGSMVSEMNDRVRELYWEAIQSVPRELVSDDDYSKGVADFLRRVFFRAARTGRWDLFRGWRTRAQAAAPCGAWRLDALTAASIARIAAKEATGRLRHDGNGKPLRVLYRR